MKNVLLIFLLLFGVTRSMLSQSSTIVDNNNVVAKIDELMQYSYENGMFNGVVLVSQDGKAIYKNALGYADKDNNRKLNKASVFYLASVSKQFTTMAIMILKEQKKLSYNDKLSQYFPEFPEYANNVTINQLMTHTSGIPDHYRLGAYKKGLTNKDVIELLVKQKQLDFQPGEEFSYSNGGYVLLSLIVEKVSGMPFHKFMETNIFKPLGMNNTLVYDESTPTINNRAVGYNQAGELDDYEILTTGAGGMYSTVDDLHLWDQALYTEKLVSKSTLEEAFTPAMLNNGASTNYGFGWGISEKDGKKIVEHSGGLSGYRTFIKRNLDNNSSYILLTNHGDAFNDYGIQNALDNILEGKPYTLPKNPNPTTVLIAIIALIFSLIFGTIVLLLKKGTKRHKQFGYAYLISMIISIITTFITYGLFISWEIYHYTTTISLLAIILGMISIWTKKPVNSWKYFHFSFMYWSVIGLYATVAAILSLVPGSPIFGIVGIAVGVIMIIGGIFFGLNISKWREVFKA